MILAGFVGAEAIKEEEDHKRAEAAAAAENTKPDLTVDAFDIGFREKELKIGPGEVRIEMVNTGAIAHTFVLEGVVAARSFPPPAAGPRTAAPTRPGR